MKTVFAALAVAVVQQSLHASHVVPPDYANTVGNNTFLGPMASGARTYQLLIHEDMLTDLVGQQLNGLTWRAAPSVASSWPAAERTFASYDIYLGESVAPQDRSLIFANNVVGSLTQVRSGSLVMPVNSFTVGGSPNEFGRMIDFNAWTYVGGHLLVEIRHTGNGAGTPGNMNVDALGTSTPGYGTMYSAAHQTNYTATTALSGANFGIIMFNVVPGPSALLALGAGIMFGGSRRRRA